MKLIEVARLQRDLLNEGIAYIAVWQETQKNGKRSWFTEDIFPADTDKEEPIFDEEQKARLAEIAALDSDAVLLNGYYHAWIGSADEPLNAASIAKGIENHYLMHSALIRGYLADAPEAAMTDEIAKAAKDLDYGEAQHYPGRYANPNEPPTEAMLKQAAAWMEGQPDFESLQLTEREELGLGREQRENRQGENGMQASDVPERYHYRAELNDPDSPERMEVFSADNDEDAIRQAYGYTGDGVTLLELLELDGDYNEIRSVGLLRKPEGLVIEMPLKGFTPEKLDNLFKLVNAKAALLKAALGADELPINQTADTLQFHWFWEENILTSEETAAYATLISLLCKTAKEKKRVTAKEKAVEGSPKYAMRCFLLSLGFIGDEYKTARKILLSRLEGNSSWKNGKKAEAVTEPCSPDSEGATE